MIKRRRRPSFLLKAPQPLAIGNDILRQHLQRNLAVELSVVSQVNVTHPASPNLR